VICCAMCKLFVADSVGDGSGIGRCRVYSARKKQGASERELRDLLIELGNHPDDPIFWGGDRVDRNCNRYERKL
jgi:hypothetical protein